MDKGKNRRTLDVVIFLTDSLLDIHSLPEKADVPAQQVMRALDQETRTSALLQL